MACGAESRIAKKYAAFVEETKQHAQFMSPLIALQFGLIVRCPGTPVRLLQHADIFAVLWCFCSIRSRFLVRHQVIC